MQDEAYKKLDREIRKVMEKINGEENDFTVRELLSVWIEFLLPLNERETEALRGRLLEKRVDPYSPPSYTAEGRNNGKEKGNEEPGTFAPDHKKIQNTKEEIQ